MLFESLGLKDRDGESHHVSNMAGGQTMIRLVAVSMQCACPMGRLYLAVTTRTAGAFTPAAPSASVIAWVRSK